MVRSAAILLSTIAVANGLSFPSISPETTRRAALASIGTAFTLAVPKGFALAEEKKRSVQK